MISNYELGWYIGLLEGEGSFGYYGRTQRVSMEMTDEDTMRRYIELTGRICGKAFNLSSSERTHRINRENHSTMYRLTLTGENARLLMRFVVSHMSSRRRAKIWQCLNAYQPKKKSLTELGFSISDILPYAAERMSA